MKALVRNKGETVLESYDIPGIDWKNGYPLTDPGWAGGPYTLIENYVPNVEKDLDFIGLLHEQLIEEPEEEIVDEDDYVVIDGKKYSKEELRSLIE